MKNIKKNLKIYLSLCCFFLNQIFNHIYSMNFQNSYVNFLLINEMFFNFLKNKIDVINTNIASGLLERLRKKVDIIICNPVKINFSVCITINFLSPMFQLIKKN